MDRLSTAIERHLRKRAESIIIAKHDADSASFDRECAIRYPKAVNKKNFARKSPCSARMAVLCRGRSPRRLGRACGRQADRAPRRFRPPENERLVVEPSMDLGLHGAGAATEVHAARGGNIHLIFVRIFHSLSNLEFSRSFSRMVCFAFPSGRGKQSASDSASAKKDIWLSWFYDAATCQPVRRRRRWLCQQQRRQHMRPRNLSCDSAATGRPAAADFISIGRRRCRRRRWLSCRGRAACAGAFSVRALNLARAVARLARGRPRAAPIRRDSWGAGSCSHFHVAAAAAAGGGGGTVPSAGDIPTVRAAPCHGGSDDIPAVLAGALHLPVGWRVASLFCDTATCQCCCCCATVDGFRVSDCSAADTCACGIRVVACDDSTTGRPAAADFFSISHRRCRHRRGLSKNDT
jgi:hypothetical protein